MLNANNQRNQNFFINEYNNFRFDFQFDFQSIFFMQTSNFNFYYQQYNDFQNQNRVYSQQQYYQQQSSYQRNQFSNNQSSQQTLFSTLSQKQIVAKFAIDSKKEQKSEYVSNNRQQFKFIKSRIYYENETSINSYDENEYYENKSTINTTKQNFIDQKTFMYETSQSKKFFHESNDDESKINFFVTSSTNFKCRMCQIEFYFNNKLHRHVRFCQKKRKNVVEIVAKTNYETIENIFIVDFTVIIISNEKYNFRR